MVEKYLEENELLLNDRIMLHDLYLERYEKNTAKEFKKVLKELYKKVTLELFSIEDIDSIKGKRLLKFIASLKPYLAEFDVELTKKQKDFLYELIEFEAGAEIKIAQAGISGVDLIGFTTEKLAAATAMHMGTGHTINELFENTKTSIISKIKTECAIGFLQGETTQQMVSRLKSLEGMGERAATALVRTTMTHVSAQARNLVAKENLDVIKKVKWNSVLDYRTSPKCRYRDGKLWDADENFPMPPAHVNCRSSIVYITGTQIAGLTRASKFGQVDISTQYYDFLKRQPKNVIVDILGKERAELFYNGKLTGDQLHARDGALLTMEDLRKKYDL